MSTINKGLRKNISLVMAVLFGFTNLFQSGYAAAFAAKTIVSVKPQNTNYCKKVFELNSRNTQDIYNCGLEMSQKLESHYTKLKDFQHYIPLTANDKKNLKNLTEKYFEFENIVSDFRQIAVNIGYAAKNTKAAAIYKLYQLFPAIYKDSNGSEKEFIEKIAETGIEKIKDKIAGSVKTTNNVDTERLKKVFPKIYEELKINIEKNGEGLNIDEEFIYMLMEKAGYNPKINKEIQDNLQPSYSVNLPLILKTFPQIYNKYRANPTVLSEEITRNVKHLLSLVRYDYGVGALKTRFPVIYKNCKGNDGLFASRVIKEKTLTTIATNVSKIHKTLGDVLEKDYYITYAPSAFKELNIDTNDKITAPVNFTETKQKNGKFNSLKYFLNTNSPRLQKLLSKLFLNKNYDAAELIGNISQSGSNENVITETLGYKNFGGLKKVTTFKGHKAPIINRLADKAAEYTLEKAMLNKSVIESGQQVSAGALHFLSDTFKTIGNGFIGATAGFMALAASLVENFKVIPAIPISVAPVSTHNTPVLPKGTAKELYKTSVHTLSDIPLSQWVAGNLFGPKYEHIMEGNSQSNYNMLNVLKRMGEDNILFAVLFDPLVQNAGVIITFGIGAGHMATHGRTVGQGLYRVRNFLKHNKLSKKLFKTSAKADTLAAVDKIEKVLEKLPRGQRSIVNKLIEQRLGGNVNLNTLTDILSDLRTLKSFSPSNATLIWDKLPVTLIQGTAKNIPAIGKTIDAIRGLLETKVTNLAQRETLFIMIKQRLLTQGAQGKNLNTAMDILNDLKSILVNPTGEIKMFWAGKTITMSSYTPLFRISEILKSIPNNLGQRDALKIMIQERMLNAIKNKTTVTSDGILVDLKTLRTVNKDTGSLALSWNGKMKYVGNNEASQIPPLNGAPKIYNQSAEEFEAYIKQLMNLFRKHGMDEILIETVREHTAIWKNIVKKPTERGQIFDKFVEVKNRHNEALKCFYPNGEGGKALDVIRKTKAGYLRPADKSITRILPHEADWNLELVAKHYLDHVKHMQRKQLTDDGFDIILEELNRIKQNTIRRFSTPTTPDVQYMSEKMYLLVREFQKRYNNIVEAKMVEAGMYEPVSLNSIVPKILKVKSGPKPPPPHPPAPQGILTPIPAKVSAVKLNEATSEIIEIYNAIKNTAVPLKNVSNAIKKAANNLTEAQFYTWRINVKNTLKKISKLKLTTARAASDKKQLADSVMDIMSSDLFLKGKLTFRAFEKDMNKIIFNPFKSNAGNNMFEQINTTLYDYAHLVCERKVLPYIKDFTVSEKVTVDLFAVETGPKPLIIENTPSVVETPQQPNILRSIWNKATGKGVVTEAQIENALATFAKTKYPIKTFKNAFRTNMTRLAKNMTQSEFALWVKTMKKIMKRPDNMNVWFEPMRIASKHPDDVFMAVNREITEMLSKGKIFSKRNTLNFLHKIRRDVVSILENEAEVKSNIELLKMYTNNISRGEKPILIKSPGGKIVTISSADNPGYIKMCRNWMLYYKKPKGMTNAKWKTATKKLDKIDKAMKNNEFLETNILHGGTAEKYRQLREAIADATLQSDYTDTTLLSAIKGRVAEINSTERYNIFMNDLKTLKGKECIKIPNPKVYWNPAERIARGCSPTNTTDPYQNWLNELASNYKK